MEQPASDSNSRSPTQPAGRSRRRFGIIAGVTVAVLGTLLLALQSVPDSAGQMSAWSAPFGLGRSGPSAGRPAGGSRTPASGRDGTGAATEAGDEQLRRRLVGRWTQHDAGRRSLTVRGDGTATMTIEPEGVWTYLLGSKLRVDVEWRVEDGYLSYSMTGGHPQDKVELVTKMWGDRRVQEIEKLTEETMVLLDEEGEPGSEWERVE